MISTATILTHGGSGSAFFVSNEGHLISNEHVTKSEKEVEVQTFDGKKHKGTVLKIQNFYDLALIKIESRNYPPLKLGDATKLHPGDTVWTIGAPHGLEFSVTKGIASYVGRNVGGKAFVQADVAINPGNSGGPMINDDGEVIGVNNFIIKQTVGLNFAIRQLSLQRIGIHFGGIVPTVSDSGTMATWRSWERQAGGATRSQEQPETRDSPGIAASSGDVSNLLKQLKASESTLQNIRDKMNKEFQTLDQRINKLTGDYANETTISKQEKIGLEIRRLKVQQVDVELKKIDAFLEYNKTASGLMIRAKQLSIDDATKTKHYDEELSKLAQSKSESENNRTQLMQQRQVLLN
ncbi:MAG: trypsin-like peptidase domain-containing protein [Bdellovibrionota bacterium]